MTSNDSPRKDKGGASSSAVSVHDRGSGVFAIRVADLHSDNALSRELAGELVRAIDAVRRNASVKVLILEGTAKAFLHGERARYNDAVEQGLYQSVISFPYPLIAAMRGDASGAGFLVGALCDFMVCSQSASYRYTQPEAGFFPTTEEDRLFSERFGRLHATDFLYHDTSAQGRQLQEKGWTCAVMQPEQVESHAQTLALNLAGKSQDSLRLLKQHLARRIHALAQSLGPVVPAERHEPVVGDGVRMSAPGKHLQLETPAENVLLVRICDTKNEDEASTLVADVGTLFAQINDGVANRSIPYRALVLVSEHIDFLPVSAGESALDAVRELQAVLAQSSLPVIAVLDPHASGKAWLISQFCNATIYAREGSYCVADLLHSPPWGEFAAQLFSGRFGSRAGRDIVMAGTAYSGAELRRRIGPVPVVAQDQTLPEAVKLAQSWAAWPLGSVTSWSKLGTIKLTEAIDDRAPSMPRGDAATPIPLKSKVITAMAHPDGIVTVRLEDREAKNLFSDEFVQGINEIFRHIDETPDYKVVVLTGYDKYFASGGTKKALEAIQDGTAKFTDEQTYLLTLVCKIPVIAAMQGHGIGGGLSLGLFADFVILSEESKYLSPYMGYGFTPGGGATLIVPEKLGHDLGKETLFTAQEYSGSELKDRGLPFSVVPRKAVQDAALALAQQVARYSRVSLISLKQYLNRSIHERLEQNTQQEIAMHERTFVGAADTLKQIQANFNAMDDGAKTQPAKQADNTISASAAVAHQATVTDTPAHSLEEIATSITQLLAQELHMQVSDIDEETSFIDLGLDSITGVTWMRKINDRYRTSIQATKVYSHSTIAKLSVYVYEQIEQLGASRAHTPASTGHADTHKQIRVNLSPAGDDARTQTARPDAAPIAAAQGHFTGTPAHSLPEITASIKQLLAQELHMQVDDIDEETSFIDLGLDSITGVTWMRKINDRYRTSIQATKVYSHSTLTMLSAYIKGEIERLGVPSAYTAPSKPVVLDIPPVAPQIAAQPLPKADSPFSRKSRNKLASWRDQKPSRINNGPSLTRSVEPVAVIGMAGQFPKANNLEQYWDNLAQGRNCISEIPRSRWDLDSYYQEGDPVPGKTNSKWMGSLEEYDLFDPLFFDISPKEAISMDPQQRIFLQTCWHTIENAGYNPRSLSGSKCGVFAGCGPGDYHLLSRDLQISALGFTGGDTSILAARVSYFLNLQGPCLSIETACSSSLVAIATACDSLAAGNSDLALAGGVGLITGPELHIKMAQTGMLSPDGKCFTFDQRANGFAPGEGVGAVLLKRLSDAERDQDIILGVIHGWGVNQDGKTNGITAPNPDSQARLQQDIYDKFGIDPADIQLIEAHGTGTKLGDPIEVDALQQSFKKYTQKKNYCALGSVKSNIGHCFTAAGVASVLKVLLALQHKQLPPTINFAQLNEHIGLNDSPFYVNDRLQAWELQGAKRRQAAISAFGFGGTNAHLVIAEYSAPPKAAAPIAALTENGKLIVPLSAKKEEQLKQKAADLLDFLSKKGRSVDLLSLAYTLQVGREATEERLGFLVGSLEELAGKLRSYLAGEPVDGMYQGRPRDHKEAMSLLRRDADMRETIVDKLIAQRDVSKLLDLWVKDLQFDWNKLYGSAKPQRIQVPTYPFAKDRYWIDSVQSAPLTKPVAVSSALHPLLHRNTSNLHQLSFSSAFRGDEFFLEDYAADGVKVLSGSACLEMVRAAAAQITSTLPEAAIVELHDLVWGRPFVAADGKDVTIALFANADESIDFEIYSKDNGEETVHCQGRAAIVPQSASPKLDVAPLKEQRGKDGTGPLSVQVSLPKIPAHGGSDYILHPKLLDSVLQACAGADANFSRLAGLSFSPSSLQYLRVASAYTAEATAWVRYSPGSPRDDLRAVLDIELGDQQGNVGVQIRGLSLQQLSLGSEQAASVASIPASQQVASAPAMIISHAQLQQELKESLADALFLKAADIRVDKPFIELGLDSIVGVEWINEINKKYKVKIAATKVYDYPNIVELASYLRQEIEKSAPPSAGPVASSVIEPAPLPAVSDEAPADVISLAQLQQELKESLADALFLKAADIRVDKPFVELGLDSIVGVEWINEINKKYKVKITATKVYDYPNITELASYLRQEIEKVAPPAPKRAAPPVVEAAPPPAITHDEPADVISPAQLQQELKESLADALFLKASDIRVDKPFIELGLDSIVGVEWINEINKKYKVKIAATKVYDYPNIVELASYLRQEIEKTAAAAPKRKPSAPAKPAITGLAGSPAPSLRRSYPSLKRSAGARQPISHGPAPVTDKIAVIGMSGRYPKAKDLNQFWENLAQGRDCITEMPASRWDVNQYYDPDPKKEDKIYCKWIGMLDDIECFDPLFFRISPAEAKNMDPQHRMLLEEGYKAFENAGYSNKALSNKKCGVYVGIIGTEYAALVSNSVDITGNNPAIGAARIAYFLNLKGPAISIDTACSASLVAIHLACQGLLTRETDMALAGGVSIWISPEPYAGMCRAGMLSPDGRCKTFDNSANGFVPGEGVGAVVLKRLEDAERDNDFICGVILGSGINQDGKTNGITAPSANAQMELERGLYAKYGIDPETISYVETHGTGTKLGDPIELDALSTVFKEKTAKKNYCGLGSVKSNIGHTSGAAGVASVQKVLLCMKHRTLVPTLHVTKENSLFDFENSPFYIMKEARPWDVAPGTLRRAAVSSFGFSGTNAHLVLEEYMPHADKHAVADARHHGDIIIPLSARTADQLQQKAQDLLRFIRSEEHAQSLDFLSTAYTLHVGREAMDERLGIIAGSLDQLAAKLEAYLGGDRNVENVYRGKVERNDDGVILLSQQEGIEEVVDQCLAQNDFSKLAGLWLRGLELEWTKLYGKVTPQRIALPTYPFAKKRCWADPATSQRLSEAATVAAVLHPLLHRNISVLGQQSYSATFGGQESFLIEDAGQKVLPAAAYLEMARAAVENATPESHGSSHLELHKVVWGRSLAATKDRQVNVALFRNGDEQVDFEIYSQGQGAQSSAEEILHCQGHAVFIHQPDRAKLDLEKLKKQMAQGRIAATSGGIEALYRGDGELLAQLQLPAAAAASLSDYILHPSLMDSVLHAAMGLMEHASRRPKHLSLPFALESIRIESACTEQMFAWVRYAQGSQTQDKVIKLDIDVCDGQGRVCAQMRGVAYDPVPVSEVTPISKSTAEIALPQAPVVALERHGIALSDPQSQTSMQVTSKKPTQISLQ